MTPSPPTSPYQHWDVIKIRSLRLRCVIGIEEWERKTLQDVRIHLTLWLDLATAGLSDTIHDTVNYKQLTKQIIALTENSSFFLIEALAENIAQLVLQENKIKHVKVSVHKPGALRFARSVAVVIHRPLLLSA